MNFNRTLIALAFALLLPTAFIQLAIAEDITVDAPISAVTMYRNGGAIVTRTGSFTLPAGNHNVIIDGLTENMEDDYGVRAQFTAGGALVSQVRLVEKFSGQVISEAQKAINAQIEALIAQNTADRATLDSLKIQLDFIEKLGTNAGNKMVEGNADPDTLFAALQKSLEFVRTNSGSIVAERTALNEAIRVRDQEILALERQLAQTGSERKSFIDANLAVSNAAASTVTLQLSYMVDDAAWSVETDASLNSAAKTASVRLFANVSQQTGEDWADVPLTLSTTTPSTNIHNNKPRPIYMNLMDPQEIRLRAQSLQRQESAPSYDMEEVVVTGSKQRFNNTSFDAEFIIDQPVTLASDGSEQRFLVSMATANTAVVLRATPRQSRTAYVYADAELDGFPYLTRPAVSLTRDGTFVGNGQWPDLQPKSPLELPFGSTDRVKIETITLPSEDGGSGVFRKRVNKEERQQFRITNNNSIAVTIEVFDRIPTSRHEDLEVERLSGSTEPTANDVGGQPGVMMWRKTLAAGEVWAINNWYKISYPEDKRLTR